MSENKRDIADKDSVKQKAISGLIWSFVDNFLRQGITFLVGIVLARLLSPSEFGLIGMTTIFIAVSQSFVDSGFTQALIRKQNCTQTDYTTVFYFNIFVAAFFYLVLYFSSGTIASFFNEPQLEKVLQVLGLILIINAFAVVQLARLTKNINFKLQTKISAIASLVSGAIAIFIALKGFGVWSLVVKTLTQFSINSLLLWLWNKWRPSLEFSKKSFLEMYSFGSKLLITGLIDTIYKNVYLLIIGKYFSASELGFYTRAEQFKDLPSSNITNVIQRVSFPILASIQDDQARLKAAYRKLIKSTMLITFTLMLGMSAISESMVLTLIGEKWRTTVEYLQLICFVGMLFPLHALNLNILNVKGRSDLFLKLEIIKKFFAVPTIIFGVFFGIKVMIICMFFNSLISYYLNSYYSGALINYPLKEQLFDIFPSFLLALFNACVVYISGLFMPFSNSLIFIFQLALGMILFIVICEAVKFNTYVELKEEGKKQFIRILKK